MNPSYLRFCVALQGRQSLKSMIRVQTDLAQNTVDTFGSIYLVSTLTHKTNLRRSLHMQYKIIFCQRSCRIKEENAPDFLCVKCKHGQCNKTGQSLLFRISHSVNVLVSLLLLLWKKYDLQIHFCNVYKLLLWLMLMK